MMTYSSCSDLLYTVKNVALLFLERLHFVFKIGDIIDARDPESGAWFEAEIKKITKNTSGNESEPQSTETDTVTNEKTEPSKPENVGPSFSLPTMYQEDDGFLYHVLFEG